MKTTKKAYKIYIGKLKKSFKDFPIGSRLKLEYNEAVEKWNIRSNTEFEYYFDTFKTEEVNEFFEDIKYLRTDIYKRV